MPLDTFSTFNPNKLYFKFMKIYYEHFIVVEQQLFTIMKSKKLVLILETIQQTEIKVDGAFLTFI